MTCSTLDRSTRVQSEKVENLIIQFFYGPKEAGKAGKLLRKKILVKPINFPAQWMQWHFSDNSEKPDKVEKSVNLKRKALLSVNRKAWYLTFKNKILMSLRLYSLNVLSGLLARYNVSRLEPWSYSYSAGLSKCKYNPHVTKDEITQRNAALPSGKYNTSSKN